ncbi:MAG TPA: secretin N-terminal domain-containing protein [Candidatus Sulfotelmatobacter sp.]|nr:secretin N-terminal domain-containing protein [Candidatus Sulfotelmatobacter sp.]
MKTKLQILVAVISIVFSMVKTSAQQPPTPPTPPAAINPATGLPEPVPNIDPRTGLPADGSPPFKDSNGATTWIDPAWTDSGKVVNSVEYPDIPLSEVARNLREQFTNYFDVIIPNPNGVSGPTPGTLDPTQCSVNLQLKNVTATEILNAMNLQFQLDNKPVRWELTLNGSRPTAILRLVPQLGPASPPQIRKAFFVGDMLDEYPGTNDMEKLGDISGKVNDAWDATGTSRGRVHIYPAGQLLIVSGTPDQVDLAEQILRALKEKADYETSHPMKRHGHGNSQ